MVCANGIFSTVPITIRQHFTRKGVQKQMENTERKREIEIDLVPIFKALWSKLWLILLVGAIFAGTAFGATKLLIKPTYRCTFTAYVNNSHDAEKVSYQDLYAGEKLVQTYVTVIRSNTVLDAAARSVNMDSSIGSLKKMVTASVQGETEVISVSVLHKDPQTAYLLANAIANTAPTKMKDIVEGSSMKIIDFPEYSDTPYRPNYLIYTLLGFVLGVLLVVIKVVVDTLRDDTVKSEEEIEERFNLPILGMIPDALQQSGDKGKDYYAYGYGYGYGSRRSTRERINAEGNPGERSSSDKKSSRRGSKDRKAADKDEKKRGE